MNPIEYLIHANKNKLCDVVTSKRIEHVNAFRELSLNQLREFLNIESTIEPVDNPVITQWMFGKFTPVPDHEVTSCHNCNSEFNFFLRRHHCRSCGNIFCSYCSTVDKVRTCLKCSSRKVNIVIIEYLEILSLDLLTLFSSAYNLSEEFRSATEYYVNKFRSIQYKLIGSTMTEFEMNSLVANRDLLSGHSVWLTQLKRFGLYRSLPKQVPCSLLACQRSCSDYDQELLNFEDKPNQDIYQLVHVLETYQDPLNLCLEIQQLSMPMRGPFYDIGMIDHRSLPEIRYLDLNNMKRTMIYKRDIDEKQVKLNNLIIVLYDLLNIDTSYIRPPLMINRIRRPFIEILEGVSVHNLGKRSISNYLVSTNLETETGQLVYNYLYSLAFWFNMSRILNMTGSLMLYKTGVFYLTDLHPGELKLDEFLLEPVQLIKFKELSSDMFIVLRRYYNLIYLMIPEIDIITNLMMGYSEEDVKKRLMRR